MVKSGRRAEYVESTTSNLDWIHLREGVRRSSAEVDKRCGITRDYKVSGIWQMKFYALRNPVKDFVQVNFGLRFAF